MIEEKHKIIENTKEKLTTFFKDPKEVFSFFFPILITLVLLIPLPYYVKFGGGTIKLENKIEIKEKGKNGSFGALYVKESKAVILTYLLANIVPSYDLEKEENVTIDEEDTKDYNYREKLYFTSSAEAATKVAFEKAGRSVKEASSKFIIIYVDKDSKTNLEVGDQILKVNDKDITTYDEVRKYIEEGKENIKITVKRKNKIVNTSNKYMTIEGKKKLGVIISNEIKYKSDPKVNFNFGGREAGPSGGLMIALTIYDKLIKEDITKGRLVVGTGTINTNGEVGEIGGIKYKLMAANDEEADIVFVPEANYKEAKKIYDKEKYKFDLVSVKTFDDAVNYLEK